MKPFDVWQRVVELCSNVAVFQGRWVTWINQIKPWLFLPKLIQCCTSNKSLDSLLSSNYLFWLNPAFYYHTVGVVNPCNACHQACKLSKMLQIVNHVHIAGFSCPGTEYHSAEVCVFSSGAAITAKQNTQLPTWWISQNALWGDSMIFNVTVFLAHHQFKFTRIKSFLWFINFCTKYNSLNVHFYSEFGHK